MDRPSLALPISILLVLVTAGFGRRLLALFRVKPDAPVESIVLGAGTGLGVLGYAVLAAGLLGCLYWWSLLGIIALMAAVSLREIGGIVTDIWVGLRVSAVVRIRFASGLVTFSIVSMGALALIQALTPPTDWDGLAYHLAVPKMYLSRHAIYYVPFLSHSNFPFLTEMLYTLGLSFGSESVAKLFHFWMYVGTGAAIYSLGRRHFSRLVGSIGALLFMSVPVVFWEAGVAYADLTTALYLTLAAYALLNWEQSQATPWLVICGLAGGLALGTKVLALVPIGVVCLWVFFSAGKSCGFAKGVRLSLLTGGIALLVGSPWYVKSWLYTGNPVYPFMYEVFGGKYWSQGAADAYRNAQLAFGMGRGVLELVSLPWNVGMHGYRFYDSPAFIGLIGVAFLGLIPLQVFAGRFSRAAVLLLSLAVVYAIAWFVLMQQSRYLIGVLPVLCIIAAMAVETANTRWSVGRYAVNAFVAVSVGSAMLVGFLLATQSASAAFGLEARDEYLARASDVYPAEAWINENLPEGSRIALFDEVRGYYLDREYIWANPGHHEMIPWSSFIQGADMVRWFREHGYTHALVNRRFAGGALMHGSDGEAQSGNALHGKLFPDAIGHGLMQEVFGWHHTSVYEFAEQ